jgi:hypothetical protein
LPGKDIIGFTGVPAVTWRIGCFAKASPQADWIWRRLMRFAGRDNFPLALTSARRLTKQRAFR